MRISSVLFTPGFRASQPQSPASVQTQPQQATQSVQTSPAPQAAEPKATKPLETIPASMPNSNAVSINIYDPSATNN